MLQCPVYVITGQTHGVWEASGHAGGGGPGGGVDHGGGVTISSSCTA